MASRRPTAELDVATKLDRAVVAIWRPKVGEHCLHGVQVVEKDRDQDKGEPDTIRSNREAQRRAASTMRRFAAENGIDRLLTLTLAHSTELEDRAEVRLMVARAMRKLRIRSRRLHYMYVLELHPSGHGWHCHVGVNQWIDLKVLADCWGHGFVHAVRIKTKGKGSSLSQRRLCARYLGKYASKSIEEGREAGGHRYERSQGGAITEIRMECDSWSAAEAWLRSKIRGAVTWSWSSLVDGDEWRGPPTLVLWE